MADTIFGKMARGEFEADFIYEDDHCFAIHDINPQAPVHALVIPKYEGIPRLVDAQDSDQELLGHLMLAAAKVAEQLGVGDAFRLVINNGEGAGQTVFHLHLHIIAGRTFAEGQMAG